MQRRKRTRLALGLVVGLCCLAGCDDGSSSSSFTPTPADPPPPKRTASTVPMVHDEAANLVNSFNDVTGPVKPDRTTAKVIQTLAIFNHPQSSAISADGNHLFVTNSGVVVSALSGPSVQYCKGAISKLKIQPDGRLEVENVKFIDKLHAPMGIAVLNKGTSKFPEGSLFVCTGMTAGTDDQGELMTDIKKFNPGISIFSPDDGKLLGFIAMSSGHAVAKAVNHAALAPAGICFDPDGNLYMTDTANTGKDLDPIVYGRPGVMRIRNEQIDMYADDKEDPKVQGRLNILFQSERHEPAGVFYSPIDDALYWTTCDGKEPIIGGVFRTERKSFSQVVPQNILGGIGSALMGVTITPSGNLITSKLDGDLFYMLTGRSSMGKVGFYEDAAFSSPGEIRFMACPKGYNVLYVPEQEPNSVQAWKQRLRVVVLPTAL